MIYLLCIVDLITFLFFTPAVQVASFLYYQNNMNVLVEPDLHDIFARIPGFGFVQTFYSQDTRYLKDRGDQNDCFFLPFF